jgi:hypothetical protein
MAAKMARISMSVKTDTARVSAAAIVLLFLFIRVTAGEAAQFPTLPQTFIDTTYSPPSGNVVSVNAGGNFQAALDGAVVGDTIVLQAGATFTGPFTLPNKTAGSGWIYIRSSAYASLPAPGTRVSPSDAANMPKIAGGAGTFAITTASNAHHYRFVGIEFKPSPGSFVYSLVAIGNGESSSGTLPNNITFDRCYIHGDPSVGGRRGVAMDGNSVAVIDSYIDGFKEVGADSQGLWAYNAPGPYKIVNNFISAAGENVMFGGADPKILNSVPSDIEIRRNHFFKPLSLMGTSFSVKNLLEFKNAKRVLVEGNTFENNWLAGQNGFSILLTPRNQGGGCAWCGTQDITIRLNRMLNLGQGFNIAGEDDAFPSQRTARVLIKDNVVSVTSLGGADGRSFGVTHGPVDVTIDHNTIFTSGTAMAFVENSPLAANFVFTNNIMDDGVYGFLGTNTAPGTPTLNAYFSSYNFTTNAIIASRGEPYPAGNLFPANATAVGFVNLAGGDYHLSASSAYKNAGLDGKDLGADIDALTSALGRALPPPSNLRVQ